MTAQANYFLFLQEPFVRGGKVTEFGGLTHVLALGSQPRAAIDAWFRPVFSSRDICMMQWLTGNRDINSNTAGVYVVSMYLDVTAPMEDIFPEGWVKLAKSLFWKTI